jgi:subtilase family serine protease
VNRPTRLVAPLIAALAVAACSGGSSNVPATPNQGASFQAHVPQWKATKSATAACPGVRGNGAMQCDALIENHGVQPNVTGWAPADFQAVYKLPSGTKGAGQIVAIVDAYDNPNVASDLKMYRSNFGLGKANFVKYNQRGQKKNYPQGNTGWGVEIDLDVEMVSAVCPKCTIYLIEADDNYSNNLYAAVDEAVKLGAHIVSNSYGGGGGSPSGGSFSKPGVTYLASSGDSGYGEQDPADYDDVVSVGGTRLSKTGSTYNEVVWTDTGGGCSVVSKPAWQHDPGCANRTGNDVAAVAAGVAEYDTYGEGGWFTVGGTSVSSPMLGGVFALAGNATNQHGGKNFWKMKSKQRKKYLHTITSGADLCPGSLVGSYLCTAGTGQYKTYSGPTGWGTPKGIGAF